MSKDDFGYHSIRGRGGCSIVLSGLEGLDLDAEVPVVEGLPGACWADPRKLRRPLEADVDVILKILTAELAADLEAGHAGQMVHLL